MMQFLPQSFRVATRDTLMAARKTFVGVSADYLETIIVQLCEFDEAAMGSAIPMDAGSVDAAAAADDAVLDSAAWDQALARVVLVLLQ